MNAIQKPRPWKLALLSGACVYPLINLIFLTLMPLIGGWPIPVRTLLVTAILVPLMGVLMPRLQTRFRHWLQA